MFTVGIEILVGEKKHEEIFKKLGLSSREIALFREIIEREEKTLSQRSPGELQILKIEKGAELKGFITH